MTQELIIWPMVIVALATLALYFPMSSARVASVKSGKTKASVYRHNIGEPEESLRFSNAIRNQFETPTLFYAVCLAAYATRNATMTMTILAFVYAAVKLAHVLSHITTNRLRYRRPIFALSFIILIALWLLLSLNLAGF